MTALQPGTLLRGGSYRIIRALGQGGFGITYLAEQVSLGREVALKEFFMKDCCEREGDTAVMTVPTQSNRALVEKFKGKFAREARMIAHLDHPNIVRVIEVFEENGTYYYLMENLPGGSLTDKVKAEGPLPEALALGYIRQVASALDYIHGKQMVHLDVKPSNILLNAKGDAVLIDFGISKHYDKSGEQTSSTPVGLSKGYAPLEQGRDGDVSQFSAPTDIYALGATLYYLVTGAVPPEASIVSEDGLDRPGGISDAVWGAIDAAMQPRRRDRPQNIGEFLALLPGKEAEVKAEEAEDESEPVRQEEIVKPVVSPQDEETIVGGSKAKEPEEEPRPRLRKEPKQKPQRKLPLILGIAGGVVAVVLAIVFAATRNTAEYSPGYSRHPSLEINCGLKNPSLTTGAPTTGDENGYEWVDLGLSVKWATCNVGANSPEDYGAYFAWGETATKSKYTWETYKFRRKNLKFSKYNTKSSFGHVDNITTLQRGEKAGETVDDVARAKWGGNWRMPTKEEFEELLNLCDKEWTTYKGVNGWKFTSKKNSSNWIFLPAADSSEGGINRLIGDDHTDDLFYWSSSLETKDPGCAWRLEVYSKLGKLSICNYVRCIGQSVRPVSEYCQPE